MKLNGKVAIVTGGGTGIGLRNLSCPRESRRKDRHCANRHVAMSRDVSCTDRKRRSTACTEVDVADRVKWNKWSTKVIDVSAASTSWSITLPSRAAGA